VELDGAAVDLVEDAVGDGDVFGYAAAEPEDRPARAEDAVGDGYEFAASEEGAGVVLGKDGAVADGYIFGAYEVEAVVVAVDAVVDVEAVHVDALALDDTNAVVGAIEQREIADGKVFAAVGEDLVGAAKAAEAAGGWGAADGRVKLCSLSVDGARALDSDVLCVDGEEKGIVAVFEGRVAGERDCVDRVILLAVAAAEYFSCGGNVKGTLLRSSTVPMGKVPAREQEPFRLRRCDTHRWRPEMLLCRGWRHLPLRRSFGRCRREFRDRLWRQGLCPALFSPRKPAPNVGAIAGAGSRPSH